MIPAEAVEAAAKAMLAEGNHVGGWEALPEFLQRNFVRDARAALEAAAPFLMAEAFEQGQTSGMRHASRVIAANKSGHPELPGPISPNPYRPTL